jgi:undecaprenyl-diphosphatase
MIEGITLGIIQGISEWLPVSSEGLIVLARIHIFGETNIVESVEFALILHLGTFLAAAVYFRKDIAELFRAMPEFRRAAPDTKALLVFLFVATIVTGLVGGAIFYLFRDIASFPKVTGAAITGAIGVLLLVTGLLQLQKKDVGFKNSRDLNLLDSVLLGFLQGLAVLPGLSRSGLTVSAFLLRKFSDTTALKTSFLMSLPVVFLGTIALNLGSFAFSLPLLMGLIFSFLFGLATIHYLLWFAEKVNLGYFVLAFGVLVIGSAFF